MNQQVRKGWRVCPLWLSALGGSDILFPNGLLMVDIHCHIFPALDDGAKSLAEALQMAEMAIEDGITHVVGTPHANSEYLFDSNLVRERRDELQKILGDRLTLGMGCDFHLSMENLEKIRASPKRYSINQKSYLLVEFADFAIPPTAEEALHGLQLLGLSPIITHPERNPLIRSKPQRLCGWLKQGCYVQVTAQSLLGKWGETARNQVESWLDQNVVHFFASDAHNTTHRPLQLRQAYMVVAGRWGESLARSLFRENPLAAFEGKELPYEPEIPSALEAGAPARRRRKRFIFF
jgi:protein-tyrosine phosphatase